MVDMKKFSNTQIVIGVIVLVLIFLFYWFAVRPSLIKKECAVIQFPQYKKSVDEYKKYIVENCKNTNPAANGSDCGAYEVIVDRIERKSRPASDTEYEQCLRAHGF